MAGTSEGGPSVPDDVLDEADCQELLANIRVALAENRVHWEAIRTGIDLGVEEVQDQRLAQLEAPPEVSTEQQVFLLLVLFCLEGPFAPALALGAQATLLKMLSRRVTAQRYAYRRLGLDAGVRRTNFEKARAAVIDRAERAGRKATAQYAKPSQARRKQANRAAKELAEAEAELKSRAQDLASGLKRANAQAAKLTETAKALRWLSTDWTPQALQGGMKVAGQALENAMGAPTRDDQATGAPSPGVQLRVAVARSAAAAIQETFWLEREYALEIAFDRITVSRAQEMLESVGYGDPLETGAVIDDMREMSTTIVWAQLAGLGGKRATMQQAQQQAVTKPGNPRDVLIRLPTKLAGHKDYLISRFGSQAEQWARNSVTQALLGASPDDPGYVLPGNTPSDPRNPAVLEDALKAASRPDQPLEKTATTVASGVVKAVDAIFTTVGDQPLPVGSSLPSDFRLDLVLQYLEATTAGAPQITR